MLKIENLSFKFENRQVLDQLNLSLIPGETVALIGSSGSGKTTLLRLICGILSPEQGTIAVTPYTHAYMSQQDLLLPWRTLRENITLALELEKLPIVRGEIDELLKSLGIENLADRYPHEVSGGQYKRAMLARTLAPRKEILLLDEPFSSLDLPLRDKLYTYLREFNRATTLLVTHDFRDAYFLADRIVLLDRGKIGREWRLEPESRQDPSKLGHFFNEITAALSVSTRL